MDRTERFGSYFERLGIIADHYPTSTISSEVERLIAFCESYNVKVLFVGHFSAGKSALINGLIGRRDFLREDTSPQTSIAAELHYTNGKEHCFAVDESKARTPISPNAEIEPQKYMYTEYFLKCEALNALSDYVVVDTPGFDSGVENHNKALANYICNGSAYILVSDIEKGTIQREAIGFLKEVSQYSDKLIVLLNKCDKKTDEDIAAISANIADQLSSYGFDIPIHCVSAYDDDISAKLKGIIGSINAEEIFEERMKKQIVCQSEKIFAELKLIKRAAVLDTYELDKQLRRIEDARIRLKKTFEDCRSSNNDESAADTAETIISDIRHALELKDRQVAKAIACGNTSSAQSVIAETIRPVMVNSLKQSSVEAVDYVMSNIDIRNVVGEENGKDLMDIVTSLSETLKDAIVDGESGQMIDEQLVTYTEEKTKNDEEKREKAAKGKAFYQAVTGILAIAGEIAAPWIELVIVLLPDIFNLLKKLFGKSAEDVAAENFRELIIPQICEKMYPAVENAVKASRNTINQRLEELFNTELDGIMANLSEVQKTRDSAQSEYDQMIKNLECDMAELQNIIIEMGGSN